MEVTEVYRKEGTRETRGIVLAIEHFDEIVRVAPFTWSIPNSAGDDTYEVNTKHNTCTCPDHAFNEVRCKHMAAVSYKKAKTALCSSCQERKLHRDLYPVPEDHLTFFDGELLCLECCLDHGVL